MKKFFMRNPYRKFQNSSMHISKVMLCIKKRDEQKDGQTNAPEAIFFFNFFQGLLEGIVAVPRHYVYDGYSMEAVLTQAHRQFYKRHMRASARLCLKVLQPVT